MNSNTDTGPYNEKIRYSTRRYNWVPHDLKANFSTKIFRYFAFLQAQNLHKFIRTEADTENIQKTTTMTEY